MTDTGKKEGLLTGLLKSVFHHDHHQSNHKNTAANTAASSSSATASSSSSTTSAAAKASSSSTKAAAASAAASKDPNLFTHAIHNQQQQQQQGSNGDANSALHFANGATVLGNMKKLIPKSTPIEDDYSITDVALGVGVHGKVRKCIRRSTEVAYALKVLDDKPRSRKEIDLHWRCCNHPNIVNIVDVYENVVGEKKKLFLVMECMQGGELFERIQKKSNFTENEASILMRKLTSAVRHIHGLNLAHRDLKPENLLFCDETENSELKLTDFGFAKESDTGLTTPCYTPYYVAPEILRAEAKNTSTYDKSCDMWSIGVILYILIAGYPPFFSEGGQNISPGMKSRIRAGQFDFPPEEWGHVSPEVVELIKKLLLTDPNKRITIEEMWRHPWIAGTMDVPHTPLATPKILQFDQPNDSVKRDEISKAVAALRIEPSLQLKPLPAAGSSLLQRRAK